MSFQNKQFKHLISGLLCAVSAVVLHSVAFAEKADADKPTEITADHSISEGKKNVSTITGNVVLTRGTLLVKAERAVVTTAQDGTQSAVLYAVAGGKVFFRQKRDGGPDLWVEGVADRVEYDTRTELVKFISKADVKYLEGKTVTQEQQGDFLSYDSLSDVFVATNNTSGKSVDGGGRVTLILAPKSDKKVKE